MNLRNVIERRFEPVEQRYGWRDSALYALGLGCGSDPLDEDELAYVCELRPQRAVPTLCLTLGWPAFWQDDPAMGIDWQRIVHGEASFELHRPLPVEAAIRATHRITAVVDKGEGRGALVHFASDIADRSSGEALASLHSIHFLRGDGGCGSHGRPTPPLAPLDDDATPSKVVDYRTAAQAALLYRLVSHDLMPIHADPQVARSAGFERPIAHGLNTLGLACRAILKHCAPRRPERMRSMAVRFTQPAYPGETIRIELFDEGDRVRFRARALERDVVVLDRGDCRLVDR